MQEKVVRHICLKYTFPRCMHQLKCHQCWTDLHTEKSQKIAKCYLKTLRQQKFSVKQQLSKHLLFLISWLDQHIYNYHYKPGIVNVKYDFQKSFPILNIKKYWQLKWTQTILILHHTSSLLPSYLQPGFLFYFSNTTSNTTNKNDATTVITQHFSVYDVHYRATRMASSVALNSRIVVDIQLIYDKIHN